MVRLVDPINSLSGEGELTPEGAHASTSTKSSCSRGRGLPEERDKARVNSMGMLGAGDWLNAAPVRSRWSSPWQRSGGCSASIR